MTESPEYHHCPACTKRYKRREHMQRHWASHNAVRPHGCAQCGRAFQRLDVLKRHARTCEARAMGLIAPSARRRACDLCVRQKKACSAGQPCLNCERLSVSCNYSFTTTAGSREGGGGEISASPESISTESDSSEPRTIQSTDELVAVAGGGRQITAEEVNSVVLAPDPFESSLWDSPQPTAAWLDYLNFPPPACPIIDPHSQGSLVPRRRKQPRYTFHFLENFTRRTSLLGSFECGTQEFREQSLAYFLHQQQQQAEHDLVFHHMAATNSVAASPMSGLPGNLALSLSDGRITAPPLTTAMPTPQNPWLHDPLMLQIQQIVVHAKEVITTKPRNSVVTVDWSPLLEQKCLDFFSPANVRKFLALYWAVWHSNVNLIHKPTFDPAAANPTLLAAMTLIGASVSPRASDRDDAKLWFNCVEEMVYTDDDLCSEPLYTLDTGMPVLATQRRKIQALQAAFIVCLYQNFEGTDVSKRRIRRYRYGTVVSVARDIGIGNATHADLRMGLGYEFKWKEFVVKEEMIRVFLWIFLLDQAFVAFNNLPPRLVMREMRMHLARPEACFQAETAEECYEELKKWSAQSPIPPSLMLSEAVEMVCRGSMPEGMHESLAHLGPLNLFGVISAVHSLVFQHQSSFSQDGHLTVIRNALDNWKLAWDYYTARLSSSRPHNMIMGEVFTPQNAWKRIGFCRHSHDYWLLASIIVDKLSTPSTNAAAASHSQTRSTENDFAAQSPPRDNTGLRYDQTSMRQVNELIADFQRIQIFAKDD